MRFYLFGFLVSFVLGEQDGKVDYTGHKLVCVEGLTESAALKLLEAGLDEWGHSPDGKGEVFRVSPGQAKILAKLLQSYGIAPFKVINENLQALINAEQASMMQKTAGESVNIDIHISGFFNIVV